MIIYHGSNEPRPNPIYGFGKTKNDYGRGFYCTENIELAKEWACANGNDGYANKYEINMEGLRAKEYLMQHFLPDYKSYDIIIGYRADDSYFAYASDFVDNTLSLENLRKAMELGKLGEQVVLMTEKAFSALTFIEAIPASGEEYYQKYTQRDTTARLDYRTLRMASSPEEGTYIMDIIRGKWQNDDTRLR